jgi:hypothetical protein
MATKLLFRQVANAIMAARNLQLRTTFALLVYLTWFASAESQSAAAAQEHDHPVPEKLGIVKFPTSCSANVQQEFERAVALLHSFAYSAADEAFRNVTAKDPNCAMAHWGVAMSYFHQLWEPYVAPPDVGRGQAEIDQAKRIGGSERERGFIDALNLIYAKADSVPYAERANAYTLAMGKLAERNPDDVEPLRQPIKLMQTRRKQLPCSSRCSKSIRSIRAFPTI